MATPSVTYTFTAGTTIVSDQVDQNFADLVTFLQDDTVHTDGSQAMTGGLVLPNSEPSSSNTAVRRKSAYRGCAAAHPDIQTWTVAGGGSATYATMTGDGSDNFGFTPDYDYTLVVLLTGTLYQTGAGQEINIAVDAPEGTPASVFGPGANNHFAWTNAASGATYVSFSHAGRLNKPASTLPAYVVRYKVNGLTALSTWITSFAWILPQTRQSPT